MNMQLIAKASKVVIEPDTITTQSIAIICFNAGLGLVLCGGNTFSQQMAVQRNDQTLFKSEFESLTVESCSKANSKPFV